MLKLEGLNWTIGGHPVLGGVSLDITPGELVCLLGPSGCGKTSTLRIIAGLERPSAGTVVIAGHTVTSDSGFVPPQKRGIGFLFQDFALFPHLTVVGNIRFGLSTGSKTSNDERTRRMLEQMRLVEHAHKFPHMLSGGQQQRVALARALAPEPDLLLLDEPFSGLDTRLRGQIRNETRDILKATGVTTLIVTHDWEEAMLLADRIALMRDGEILQFDAPHEIYSHPVDPFAVEFFGEVNRVDGVVAGTWVETRLGRIANRTLPSGTPVEVLIRPEALRIGEDNGFAEGPAKVCRVQFAGGSSLVQLGFDQDRTHVQAKFPGHHKMTIGERLHIDIDVSQTFVFPKDA